MVLRETPVRREISRMVSLSRKCNFRCKLTRSTALTVLPITSTLVDAPLLRVTLEPSDTNGLRKRSQVMLDKISTIRCDKPGPRIETLNRDQLIEIERRLAVFLGLAD